MSSNINGLIGQALQNLQNGNFEEAKKELKYVLNVQPENIVPLELLGILYAKSRDLKQALKYFKNNKNKTRIRKSLVQPWKCVSRT